MKLNKTMLVAMIFAGMALGASAVEKTYTWSLPSDWEEQRSRLQVEVEGARVGEGVGVGGERYFAVQADGAARGVGEVGAPDLPVYNFMVTIPKNGSLKDVSFTAEWEEVGGGLLPSPVAQPVTAGEKVVYPEPGPEYDGVYPAEAAYALEGMLSGNKTLQPIRITPFKWDGTTRTLYVATRLDVKVVVVEKPTLKLTTSSVDTSEGEVLILSPHNFVSLWQGYAAFRKSTAVGKNFTFIVKDTSEIYADTTKYMTRSGDYALALHHYIESDFYDSSKCDKQYIILGASPAKTGTFNPNTMIPTRDFIGDSGSSPRDNYQVGDVYYGCMERLKAGKKDTSVEVWDVGNDGVYWATSNVDPFGFDANNSVDWTMEIAVTRVPLLERSVEKLNSSTIEVTASDMMNSFTNRIAWAESAAFETTDRGKTYVGGNESENDQKGGKDERYTGERCFFDGIKNMFDPSRSGACISSEWGPRDRTYNIMGKVQPQRESVIISGPINTTDLNGAYSRSGDLATFYSHGDWREYGNLSASRAYQGGGFYSVYATSFSCMSGKYDTNGDGAGITNALCFGEAPIVAPNYQRGALVTLTSARDGWSGGFGTLSMALDAYFLNALYGLADGTPMNVAQAGKYAHNAYAGSGAKGTTSAHGSVLGHAILCGDPLIKVFMMPDRTELTGYSQKLSVSTASTKTFDISTDVAASQAAFSDASGETLTLEGDGKFRTTSSLTVTNVGELVWSVAGGAGRNGITFVNTRGNLTCSGTAERYFGPKLTNVGTISVPGGNVTLDFDTTACDFTKLEFINSTVDLDLLSRPNVLRTRKEGFIPSTQTIPVVNSALRLQTINIGGGNATLKGTPLFYVTNGVLKVENNPYWGTEYFVRPTYLSDAILLGEYASFGLGRPDSNGYDLYVDGTSSIGGSTPIKVTGELRIHLEDADTTLTITNTLANGHGGAAGSLALSGTGTVRIATPQTFTGGITVGSGVKLVLAIANAVTGDITVQDGGKLEFETTITSGGTITLNSGAGLILPMPDSGRFRMIDETGVTLVINDGVSVYDAANPTVAMTGKRSGEYYIKGDNLRYWKTSGGTWVSGSSGTSYWLDSDKAAAAYSDANSVVFAATTPVADPIEVKVSGTVAPAFADFRNVGSRYLFTALSGTPQITLSGTTDIGQSVTFDVAIDLQGAMTVVSGGVLKMSSIAVQPPKTKVLKFLFTDTQSSGQVAELKEMRLFNNGAFLPLTTGTYLEDSDGQKIRITGCSSYSHTCSWSSSAPSFDKYSIFALVDGYVTENDSILDRWQPTTKGMPAWYTVTFPSAVTVTDYDFCTGKDGATCNPKNWVVSNSVDGTTFTLASAQSGIVNTTTHQWMTGDGTATGELFTLWDTSSKLTVREDGVLYLAGTMGVNLELEDGAVLAVTNSSAMTKSGSSTLTLPTTGRVIVDASEATKTATPFVILSGYNLTASDLAKFEAASEDMALSLNNGDLYVVTQGVKVGPYATSINTSETSLDWSALSWTDRDGVKFTWTTGINVQGSATATVDIVSLPTNGLTLGVNQACGIGTFKLTGGSDEPLTLNWTAEFLPLTIDCSAYAGKVIINSGSYTLASTEIIAGGDTWVTSSSCTAKLTIASGMRAIVNYPWNGTKTIAAGGTFGYGNDTSSSVLAMGNLKIDGRYLELAGTHVIDGTFESSTADTKIIVTGTVSTENGDNEICLAGNAKSVFEVADGTFTLGGRAFTVRNGTSAINITGGTVVSASNKGFLYNGGGYSGGVLDLNISGGSFAAMYGPYHPSSGSSGIKNNTLRVNVSGEGIFAPLGIRYSSDGNYPSTDNSSTDISDSKHAVNMTGGTFSAPTTVPNWLPVNVTSGTANLGAQGDTATIRSTVTVSSGATLAISSGTVAFGGSGKLSGSGNLIVRSGTTVTVPYANLANNITVEAGATLNLTGTALTSSGITITTGTFLREPNGIVQVNGTTLSSDYAIDGNRIVSSSSVQYGPLLQESWQQHEPYNYFAAMVDGERTPCGCVATGVSLAFHHYAWPYRTGCVTEGAATTSGLSGVGAFNLAIDGSNPFLWSEMLDANTQTTTLGEFQVARLHIWSDAMAKMCFQTGGSNTALYNVPEAAARWYEKGEELKPSTGDYRERVKQEVAAGYPVQVTITDPNTGTGHQVVIDGWRGSDGLYHVNYGQNSSATTWYAMGSASTLGAWTVESFWVGMVPRKMVQLEPISTVDTGSVTLNWHVPAIHTNAVAGFTIKDWTYSGTAGKATIDDEITINPVNADYYRVGTVYGLTDSSSLTYTLSSYHTCDLTVTLQARYDGGEWFTLDTPEVSTTEDEGGEGGKPLVPGRKDYTKTINFTDKAGKALELRFATLHTSNTSAANTWINANTISLANVVAGGEPTTASVGKAVRSYTVNNLTEGTYHSFTVTPVMDGAIESEPVGRRVVASASVPEMPAIESIDTMGTAITEGFRRTCKNGQNVFFVRCNETVTSCTASSSHRSLMGTDKVTVCDLGSQTYAVVIDGTSVPNLGNLILTIAVKDGLGNSEVKDLWLAFTTEGSSEDTLADAITQNNYLFIASNATADVALDNVKKIIGWGRAVFTGGKPTSTDIGLNYSELWRGTVEIKNYNGAIDLAQWSTNFKNDQSVLCLNGATGAVTCNGSISVEIGEGGLSMSSWTPYNSAELVVSVSESALLNGKVLISGTGAALANVTLAPALVSAGWAISKNSSGNWVLSGGPAEPDPNEMYHNTLSAEDEDVKVERGTYGDIEVPSVGYYATAYTELTALAKTTDNTYAGIIKTGTYLDTHTVVGWFKIDALPTGSNLTTIYLAKSCDNSDNGYKVAVDASGKILVGKINYANGAYSWNGSNYKTTDNAVVTAGKWFHLAVAITKTSNAKTVTPAVFVNGASVAIASGTFAGNLNGNSCSALMIGAGVTAAGIYVDTTALSDAAKVASFATNEYYLTKGEEEMPEPDPESPVLVWEGNSAKEDRTMSLAVEKGKAFTLIVRMTNTTQNVGQYIMGFTSNADDVMTPFCVAAGGDNFSGLGEKISANGFAYKQFRSGGFNVGIGTQGSSGSASWKTNKYADNIPLYVCIYSAISGTVDADGVVSGLTRLHYARKSTGGYDELSDTDVAWTISAALDTMNLNTSASAVEYKVYLDHNQRDVSGIKQIIEEIDPYGSDPTPIEAEKFEINFYTPENNKLGVEYILGDHTWTNEITMSSGVNYWRNANATAVDSQNASVLVYCTPSGKGHGLIAGGKGLNPNANLNTASQYWQVAIPLDIPTGYSYEILDALPEIITLTGACGQQNNPLYFSAKIDIITGVTTNSTGRIGPSSAIHQQNVNTVTGAFGESLVLSGSNTLMLKMWHDTEDTGSAGVYTGATGVELYPPEPVLYEATISGDTAFSEITGWTTNGVAATLPDDLTTIKISLKGNGLVTGLDQAPIALALDEGVACDVTDCTDTSFSGYGQFLIRAESITEARTFDTSVHWGVIGGATAATEVTVSAALTVNCSPLYTYGYVKLSNATFASSGISGLYSYDVRVMSGNLTLGKSTLSPRSYDVAKDATITLDSESELTISNANMLQGSGRAGGFYGQGTFSVAPSRTVNGGYLGIATKYAYSGESVFRCQYIWADHGHVGANATLKFTVMDTTLNTYLIDMLTRFTVDNGGKIELYKHGVSTAFATFTSTANGTRFTTDQLFGTAATTRDFEKDGSQTMGYQGLYTNAVRVANFGYDTGFISALVDEAHSEVTNAVPSEPYSVSLYADLGAFTATNIMTIGDAATKAIRLRVGEGLLQIVEVTGETIRETGIVAARGIGFHLFTITKTNKGVALYMDGQLVGTDFAFTSTVSGPVTIGTGVSVRMFRIDEVLLSEALVANLAAMWPVNETTTPEVQSTTNILSQIRMNSEWAAQHLPESVVTNLYNHEAIKPDDEITGKAEEREQRLEEYQSELEKLGANGLPLWQSYLQGLDPDDTDKTHARPYVNEVRFEEDAVNYQATNTVVELSYANPARNSGINVTYHLAAKDAVGNAARNVPVLGSQAMIVDDSQPMNFTPKCEIQPKKPNVIFILADDLGYGDVGWTIQNQRKANNQCYISTPHMDQMVAEGCELTAHYAAAPVCAPSRASILTGKHQGTCSLRDNSFDCPILEERTIGTVMREQGYVTHAIGKWGVGGGGESGLPMIAHPLDRGFDHFYGFLDHGAGHTYYHYDGLLNGAYMGIMEDRERKTETAVGLYSTDLLMARAKKVLIDQVATNKASGTEKPVFMYLAINMVHGSGADKLDASVPYKKSMHVPGRAFPDCTPDTDQKFGLNNGLDWDWLQANREPINDRNTYLYDYTKTSLYTDAKARYATTITRFDDAIEDLKQTIIDLGIDKNTIIVFTSDNGPTTEYDSNVNNFDSNGNFQGSKRSCMEGGLREPTFIWAPGYIKAGSVDNRPSMNHSWMQFFEEVAKSNTAPQMNNEVYSEYKYGSSQIMTRIGDYVGVNTSVGSCTLDDITLAIYNVVTDPGQTTNIVDTEKGQELLPRMQALMKSYHTLWQRPGGFGNGDGQKESSGRPYDNK